MCVEKHEEILTNINSLSGSSLFRKSISGQMTVYLTLVLAVILPLIMTMIEASRVSACRVMLESVTDMGMDSCLAEYHQELLDRYGLLFIDTSFGEGMGSLENTKDHLISYMDHNLHPEKELWLGESYSDLLGLEIDSVDFLSVARATDNHGEVFRYMALRYMLEKYGIAYAETLLDVKSNSDNYKLTLGSGDGNPLSDLNASKSKVDDFHVEPPEEAGEDWTEPEKDNPTEKVASVSEAGILNMVCSGEISGTSVNLDSYASHRKLVVGDGLLDSWEKQNILTEELLFGRYIMNEMGYYGSPREDSVLSYQVEYIIGGKDTDSKNLNTVVWQILGFRTLINAAVFAESSDLQGEAETLAATLSFVLAVPEAEQIFKALIIAGWVLAESVDDVRILMKGEKIPLLKTREDWKLSLENALSMNTNGTGNGSGMDYKEYLEVLLLEVLLDTKTERAMDIVEMDIRKITGKTGFRLDDCIAGGTIQFIFTNRYGYEFLLNREFGYQ